MSLTFHVAVTAECTQPDGKKKSFAEMWQSNLPPARTHTLSRSRMAWLHIGLKAMASLYSRTAYQRAAMAMCSTHSSRRSCINQCSGEFGGWRAADSRLLGLRRRRLNPTRYSICRNVWLDGHGAAAPSPPPTAAAPTQAPAQALPSASTPRRLILCAHHTLSTGAALHAATEPCTNILVCR